MQAAGRMELLHDTFERSLGTMSEKIVTLNELLKAEAEKLTQAARYECNEARQDDRSGHYDRISPQPPATSRCMSHA